MHIRVNKCDHFAASSSVGSEQKVKAVQMLVNTILKDSSSFKELLKSERLSFNDSDDTN